EIGARPEIGRDGEVGARREVGADPEVGAGNHDVQAAAHRVAAIHCTTVVVVAVGGGAAGADAVLARVGLRAGVAVVAIAPVHRLRVGVAGAGAVAEIVDVAGAGGGATDGVHRAERAIGGAAIGRGAIRRAVIALLVALDGAVAAHDGHDHRRDGAG